MKRTKVISFINNKGGSGKTTTCSNIGYILSKKTASRSSVKENKEKQRLTQNKKVVKEEEFPVYLL